MLQSNCSPEDACWLPGAQLNIAEAALAGSIAKLTLAKSVLLGSRKHLGSSSSIYACIHGVIVAGGWQSEPCGSFSIT
jgi:hypothetical protein